MVIKKKFLLSGAVALIVAACASRWDVKSVEEMEARGSLFDKALKQEYTDFAKLEAFRGDWDETEKFLIKARSSAAGESPQPENTSERLIPEEVLADARAAHVKLMRVLEGGARVLIPEEAAKAQSGYECWIESLEENLFVNRMEACKNKFETAMNAIENGNGGPYPDFSSDYQPLDGFYNGKYVVYFGFNSFNVRHSGINVLKLAAEAYESIKPAQVVVNGHADTVGSSKVNIIVSRKRAESVSSVLRKAGVPRNKINVKSSGENRLAVLTADNVKEPRNRRVEVEFSDEPFASMPETPKKEVAVQKKETYETHQLQNEAPKVVNKAKTAEAPETKSMTTPLKAVEPSKPVEDKAETRKTEAKPASTKAVSPKTTAPTKVNGKKTTKK